MLRVLRAELLKLRRARTVVWTVVVVAFFASMSAWGAETWAPDAPVTWAGTLTSGTVWLAGWWGVLVFSLAAAHLFGAEFSDGTASGMLTAPVPRNRFVAAKLVVLALWVLALTFVSVTAHIAIAAFQGADGFAWRLIGENVRDSLLVALLLYFTLPAVALVSMLGRGFLAPMLFSTAMTVASWTAGFLGWSEWLPWSMPATVLGGMGPPGIAAAELGCTSWVITLALFAAGLTAVFAYVDHADAIT
jgi:ABC-2 type transport system permease protein